MRQSLRLVLKVKPFKIFTAIHTIHFLICSEGRDFIIEPFFECLQESFGIAVVRIYQLWRCLNQQQSHPHRQTTEDIEVVYDIQHIIVCVIGQTTFGREIHCKAVS